MEAQHGLGVGRDGGVVFFLGLALEGEALGPPVGQHQVLGRLLVEDAVVVDVVALFGFVATLIGLH